MLKFRAIIEETFREAKARKTLVGFFFLSCFLILITFLVFQNESVQNAMNESETLRPEDIAAAALNTTVLDVMWMIIAWNLYVFALCLGIFASASFITSLMEKGTIDLMLSKPVPRWLYIMGRYTGASIIMFFEVAFFVLGIWIVVSLSVGRWNWGFPMSVIHIMLGFASLYAVVVLVSVLSRSNLLAIIAGFGIFFIAFLLSIGRFGAEIVDTGSKGVLGYIADVLYYVFPQTIDMGTNMANGIIGKDIKWTPIFLNLGLTVAYLTLSVISFKKKEF
jgi:ABC-type transport system involved in multi-copper enzyme maturation permease subunit